MIIYLANPLGWAAGSLIVAVLASNIAWLAASGRMPGISREFLTRRELPTLTWLMVSLFLLLLPLVAWLRGALSPYYLGLTGLDWIDGLAKGSSLIGLVVGLTILGWLLYRRTLPSGTRQRRIWTAPIDAALQQWHWAFYRAAAIGWLVARIGAETGGGAPRWPTELFLAQPVYWGAWLGLGLVALEWALNPFARSALRIPGQREIAWRSAALAIATTALFVLTRNLWLCLAVHLAIETTISWLLPGPQPTSAHE